MCNGEFADIGYMGDMFPITTISTRANFNGVDAYSACCYCVWSGVLPEDRNVTHFLSPTGYDVNQVRYTQQ